MSQLLQERLSTVRLRQALVSATTGSALAASALIAGFTVEMLWDYWFELSLIARAALLVGNLVLLAYIVVRFIVNPLLYGLDDESLALTVEREFPELSSRLIASIQLSKPNAVPASASAALVRAMLQETEEMTDPLDFGQVVRLKQLIKFSGIAALCIIFATANFIYAGDTTTDLLKRAFLMNVPLPKKTAVECTSGDFAAALGDDVVLSGKVSGYHPSTGTATITYDSGRTQEVTLDRAQDHRDNYAATLQSVQENFSYVLKVYDGHTDSHRVEIFPRPAVANVATTQIYPAYTGLRPEPRNTGDLSLLIGSRLQIDVTANKECRQTATADGHSCLVRIYTAGDKTQDFPLEIGADRTKLTATIPLPSDATGFTLHLVDDRGLLSKDPVMYRIDMVEDRPPTIQIIQPDRREILTTQDGTPQIEFIAQDDIGLAKMTLHYKVEGGAEGTMVMVPAPDLTKTAPVRVLHYTYSWPINAVPPVPGQPIEGTNIEFWLDINDTRAPTPNLTSSDHYSARIVSRAVKQAELEQRLADLSTDLDHDRQGQRDISNQLHTLGESHQPAEGNHP